MGNASRSEIIDNFYVSDRPVLHLVTNSLQARLNLGKKGLVKVSFVSKNRAFLFCLTFNTTSQAAVQKLDSREL